MGTKRQFGVSTHLYHNQRLSRDHLLEIAAHGFEAVELFATRTHLDYHNPAVVGGLQQWLAEAGLELHGIHAPISQRYGGGRPGPLMSIASADPEARAFAVAEAERALHVARRIPVNVLVAHLGVPRIDQQSPSENSRDAARRSVEELYRLAEPLGVRVAIEIIPNELSRAGSLVHFIEENLNLVEELDRPDHRESTGVGVCLDFGHAHMEGDLVETIEVVSGHLMTTHVHDNRGRTDDHLVPFEGTIDWASALTAIQKVGYEGVLLFEIVAHGPAKDALARAQKARQRMERLLAD